VSVFIIVSAMLTLALLAWALRPLWPGHRTLALALMVVGTGLTAALYLQFGKPEAIGYIAPAPGTEIDNALTELQGIVAAQPENLEARVLLARSFLQLGRYGEAQVHLSEALKRQPGNAGLMVDFAESLFRAGKPDQPDPQAKQWIDKAIAIEPGNQRAVFFKGILLLQEGKPGEAAKIWESLLPQLDANTAQALIPQINQARAQAGQPPIEAPAMMSIAVTVDMDPALRGSIPEGAVLFVFARQIDGAGPPVAAKRIAAPAFPLQVSLSDADSVMPTAKLSSLPRFSVSAKLSTDGTANAAGGAWQSDAVTVQSDKLGPVNLMLRQQP
jgi:cytochrome c-type biogenesis protein CcmH